MDDSDEEGGAGGTGGKNPGSSNEYSLITVNYISKFQYIYLKRP